MSIADRSRSFTLRRWVHTVAETQLISLLKGTENPVTRYKDTGKTTTHLYLALTLKMGEFILQCHI